MEKRKCQFQKCSTAVSVPGGHGQAGLAEVPHERTEELQQDVGWHSRRQLGSDGDRSPEHFMSGHKALWLITFNLPLWGERGPTSAAVKEQPDGFSREQTLSCRALLMHLLSPAFIKADINGKMLWIGLFGDWLLNGMVRFSLNTCCVFFFSSMKLKKGKLHNFCFKCKNFSPHFSSGPFLSVV